MPQIWNTSPRFTTGHVMTATMHLNSLARNIEMLRDDLLGVQPPFWGSYHADFAGYIRHRTNYFYWEYQVENEEMTITIKINGVQVRSDLRAVGSYGGTEDISGLSLTVGNIYTVTVEASAHGMIVWNLCEVQTLSYPAFATFANETVPTAAEWQNISTWADNIALELNHPYVMMPRTGWYEGHLVGSMYYRARDLTYSIDVAQDDTGNGFTITYGGVVVEEKNGLTNGGIYGTPIDLQDKAPGLTRGERYHLDIDFGRCRLYMLCGVPMASPSLAGWQAMPSWTHGDFVKSSIGSPPEVSPKYVDTMINNLALLQAMAVYENQVVREPIITPTVNWQYSTFRRFRWLHYANSLDDEGKVVQAKLGFNYNGDTKEVVMPQGEVSNGYKNVYDLESAGGCWPGSFYVTAGVEYSIEDVEP